MKSQAINLEKLAVAVRTRRGSRSLDQAAEESGLDKSFLYRVEKESAVPELDNYFALCDWLDVPVDLFRRRQHTDAA